MFYLKRVLLPLALLIYIAVETYLKLHHTSLCDDTGCKLAGELLRFKPIYLNYLGLFASLWLVISGYFSKNSPFAKKLFFITLYSALAFETVMIGFQFYANPTLCTFCLGIFSSLLLIALINAPKNGLVLISSVIAIFVALSTLSISKNISYINEDANYLINSSTCPHCLKVKEYLHKENIKYISIPIKDPSAQKALKFLGITKIPVWIERQGAKSEIYVGDEAILAHLQKSDESQEESTHSQEAPTGAQDLFKLDDSSGCTTSVIDVESSCAK